MAEFAQPAAGSYVINPGSVFQSYNPSTGQTTYGGAPASFTAGAGATPGQNNFSYGGTPTAVATPKSTPAGAQVYQGSALGYAPSSAATNFAEQMGPNGEQTGVGIPSAYSLAPNKFADIKLNQTLEIPSEPAKVSEKAATIVSAAEQKNKDFTNVSSTLQDISQLSKMANANFINAAIKGKFGRNASKEEIGLVPGSQFNLTGKTVAEVAKILGYSVPGTTSTLPGSNPDVPETQQPAAPEVALPDGTIDINKLQADVSNSLKGINDLIAQETELQDSLLNELGNQPGVSMGLIQGQEAYQQRKKEIRLNRLLDEKKTLLETADINLKFMDYARQLRNDQQQAMASVISEFMKNGVPLDKTMASKYSALTGIPAQALEDGFAIAAANYKATNKDYATGIIGEYQFAKEQGYKGTFEQYQNEDANRKIAQAKIAAGTEMTPAQVATFNQIANKYSASPLIAASDRTIVLKNAIESARKDPTNGAEQLKLVYSYVQALDTYQSAVREGELSLVNSIDSKAGQISNYIQQVQNGQIVRPEVIKQIADASSSLVDTISTGAKSKEQMYASQANVSGVGDAWRQFTGGFSSNYSNGEQGNVDFTDLDKALKEAGFKSVGNDTNTVALGGDIKDYEGKKGGQCGSFVNRLTGLTMGDTFESKMALTDPSIKQPKPGMAFVMPYKGYGHTGIILDVNNGVATVMDSNWGLDEKIKTHKIAVSKMSGFVNV